MSDLLIKGMEMPRTCYDCKFRKRNGLELICPVLGRSYKIADTQVLFVREKDCPLIEVPEPHGRLGDLTAIEDQLDYIANLDWNKQVGASGGMLAALEVVEDAPTIIPASEEGE